MDYSPDKQKGAIAPFLDLLPNLLCLAASLIGFENTLGKSTHWFSADNTKREKPRFYPALSTTSKGSGCSLLVIVIDCR
ncbi:hypothetical protein QU814_02660 [Providencia rettgeri]|nr:MULTISPECIES: hypothetical protein [Providencia]MDI7243013.1 hypothetical protein [Providencia rettgeri]MDK3109738.1 hypothetical protein [Providencia rettgeri]MDL9988374.1 hypothetical protein [Providencia rettgeri]MDM9282100.1 hypothetical protein [Providencia rettgeri]